MTKAGWKAALVRPFMMLPYDSKDILVHTRLFRKECHAELAMLFQQCLVLSGAFVSLPNQIAWETDIACVVEQGSHSDQFL